MYFNLIFKLNVFLKRVPCGPWWSRLKTPLLRCIHALTNKQLALFFPSCMRSSAVDPEWRAARVHLTVHHGLDPLPSFTSDPAVVRVRHAVAAGVCVCVCVSRASVGGTPGVNATGRAWEWMNVYDMHKLNLTSVSFRPQSLKEGLTAEQRLHLFDNKDTKDFWRASLHVHNEPAYFSPVINHLDTLITAYIKHGMTFEFYSLRFMHFSYCELLLVGFHRHVLM